MMFRATVEEIDGIRVKARGKWLTCIGNKSVKVGDSIWTDGRCVYGNSPYSEQPFIPINRHVDEEIVPIHAASNGVGYISMNGTYTFKKCSIRGRRLIHNGKQFSFVDMVDMDPPRASDMNPQDADMNRNGDIYTLFNHAYMRQHKAFLSRDEPANYSTGNTIVIRRNDEVYLTLDLSSYLRPLADLSSSTNYYKSYADTSATVVAPKVFSDGSYSFFVDCFWDKSIYTNNKINAFSINQTYYITDVDTRLVFERTTDEHPRGLSFHDGMKFKLNDDFYFKCIDFCIDSDGVVSTKYSFFDSDDNHIFTDSFRSYYIDFDLVKLNQSSYLLRYSLTSGYKFLCAYYNFMYELQPRRVPTGKISLSAGYYRISNGRATKIPGDYLGFEYRLRKATLQNWKHAMNNFINP